MSINPFPVRTAERGDRVGSSSDAMRRIADLLDGLPGLPEHVVSVYSHNAHIGVLFGAGPDEHTRVSAVQRVLAVLDATAEHQGIEYGGTGALGPYTVEVSTGFD